MVQTDVRPLSSAEEPFEGPRPWSIHDWSWPRWNGHRPTRRTVEDNVFQTSP